MNKVLHVLVYVFLALAAAALYFELQLNDKRSELTDRNRMQEDYFIKIAKTIEKADPAKDAAFEIKKDVSPVEAKEVDSPDMENLLEEYPAKLEQAQLDTYDWNGQRDALRRVYALDGDGKPLMDGNQPQTRDSDEAKLLEKLFESAKTQQTRLNSTRAALSDLRGKLEGVVNELNKLKGEARQDKVALEANKDKMAKLEEEKTALEGQVTKIKGQITDLNGEITSKNDEITTLKDEVEAAKAETAKMKERNDRLTKMLQESIQTRGAQSQDSSVGAAVTSLPAGDKGVITVVDNENMFAIVKFSDEVMKELKGENLDKALPMIELGVKRPGFKGAAGEFIGRIRLRQEVKGKNYAICDILGAWEQAKIAVNDVLFAD